VIKSIHLQNWKSFRNATLYFDPLTILIGTNASGKSNALDAIDFLARMGQGKDLATCLRSESNGDSFRGGVDWVATKGEDTFTISLFVSGAVENEEYQYSIEVSPSPKPLITSERLLRHKRRPRSKTNFKPLQIFWTDPCQPEEAAITTRLYNEKGGTIRQMQRGIPILSQLQVGVANIARQEIQSGLNAVSSALSRLFLLNPIPSHMRDYCQKSERLHHDGSNLAGVIAALPESRKKEIENTILSYVSALPEKDIISLKAELYGPFRSDAMLICEEQWSKTECPLQVDARAMSDGTLRFIAILTALLTLPEGTQLVIEEIDNGLHPSRSDLLLKMLREIGSKRSVDIVATTHNPALLDALGPEMVPFVIVAHRDPESGDSKLTLLEDVENLPKLMAQGKLGTIATSGALERSLNPSFDQQLAAYQPAPPTEIPRRRS
jgi:predicted ATPase